MLKRAFAQPRQVWRRYMNEVAKLELIDTTRVGGVDVTRQRKLVKNSDSILFESQDRVCSGLPQAG